jgi:hypothetical protein
MKNSTTSGIHGNARLGRAAPAADTGDDGRRTGARGCLGGMPVGVDDIGHGLASRAVGAGGGGSP